jgi:hypothetical protein
VFASLSLGVDLRNAIKFLKLVKRNEILPQYRRPLTAVSKIRWQKKERRRVRKDEHGLDRHLSLRGLHAILFHAFRSNIIKDSLNIYFLIPLPFLS